MRALKWGLVALAAVLALSIAAGLVLFYRAPERALSAAIDYERRQAGLARREATLSNGLRYIYLEGGRGAPLVLLHGFGADKDSFDRIAPYLTPHFRLVVPDQLGFGESSKPPKADYAPRAQAERLHALLGRLGLSQVHLGGNSMGGQIALTYAAMYPKEVLSLWILNAAGVPSAPPSEMRRKIAEGGDNPLLVQNEDEYAALVDLVTARPLHIPRRLLDVMAQPRIRNYSLEERIFKQVAADSVEERIRGLAIPALIEWGQQDRVLHPGGAGVLQMLLIRSQAVLLPDVGHLPMVEAPERCARDYLQFRAGL
ncbi:MAG: alpha/beta fold hydrolase [Burkholderiales bacterium]